MTFASGCCSWTRGPTTTRSLDGYDRLIDALREDPAVLARTWVDVSRLCAAYRMDEDAAD